MLNGECPIGAAHAQQIRLLEENMERVDLGLSAKADTERLLRIEAKVDRIGNMFWAMVTLLIANLAGIVLMLVRLRL